MYNFDIVTTFMGDGYEVEIWSEAGHEEYYFDCTHLIEAKAFIYKYGFTWRDILADIYSYMNFKNTFTHLHN